MTSLATLTSISFRPRRHAFSLVPPVPSPPPSRTATERLDSLPQRVSDWARYQDGQHGPLSATGVRQVAAFFRTQHQDADDVRPYIHLEIIGQLTDPERGSRCPNCTRPGEDSVWYDQMRFSPVLLHPRYSGEVRGTHLGGVRVKAWDESFGSVAAKRGVKCPFATAAMFVDRYERTFYTLLPRKRPTMKKLELLVCMSYSPFS